MYIHRIFLVTNAFYGLWFCNFCLFNWGLSSGFFNFLILVWPLHATKVCFFVSVAFCSGQVLQHVNLGEFVGRNVPSLKVLEKEISHGSSMGPLSLLRTAMQLIQRWVMCVCACSK